MKKISLFICSTFFIFSCGPIYYAPNATHAPLFTERKQIAASAVGTDGGIQFDAAYSLSDRVMICTSGSFASPKEDESGNGGTGSLIELGAGYYKPITENFVMGATGLLGVGKMENHYPSAGGSVEADLFRWSIQPYIGYTSQYFEGVITTRFVGVNYSSIKGQLTLNNIEQGEYLRSNSSQMFFEPSVTLRVGYKFIFFQLQDVASINLSDSNFPYDDNTITGGVYFRYQLGGEK